MRLIKLVIGAIRKRLPGRQDVLPVFNFVIFVIFSWSVRGFLFELSSFLLYFQLGEIASILFYMLAFALVESILIMGVLLVSCLVLPSNWLKKGFRYKSFLLIIVATIGLIVFQGYYKVGEITVEPLILGFLFCFLAFFSLLVLFNTKWRLIHYLLSFMEQFSVFAYIYVPLGLIGLLVVIVRNLIKG
jgi:hypothetical protein